MNSDTIVIAPYSKPMRNGKRNPKEYNAWPELIKILESHGWHLIQLSRTGEAALVKDTRYDMSLKAIDGLLQEVVTWISIDSFLPHLAVLAGVSGVVLWGKGDPNIFGHASNLNLLKDRNCLRSRQFGIWEEEEYDPSVFVTPEEVVKRLEAVWPLHDTPATNS